MAMTIKTTVPFYGGALRLINYSFRRDAYEVEAVDRPELGRWWLSGLELSRGAKAAEVTR